MKDFIPYEQALELKELGFDEPCFAIHSFVDGELNFMYVNTFHSNDDVNEKSAAAPLYQQAFRWFREKYHIIGEVKFKGGKTTKTAWYDYVIYSEIDWDDKNPNEQWKKYEEAELACLIKLIEIVKTK
jgi:hypothetical protein